MTGHENIGLSQPGGRNKIKGAVQKLLQHFAMREGNNK